MEKFRNILRSFGKEIGAFFSSRFVLFNLGGMVGLLVVTLFATFFFMQTCTRHGEKLEVEDFTGMHIKEAIAKARNLNFRIVVSDSIDRGEYTPLTVRSQVPKPFSKVKKNRTIYLTIYKYNRDKVKLPSLIGADNFERYSARLEARGLKARVRERILNRLYEPATILRVYDGDYNIPQGKITEYEVEKGSVIELDITERGENFVKMPDITCSQFERAKQLIESYQLVLGSINEDPTVTDRSTAYVYQQVPEYNPTQKIRIGQQISIYLTQNMPADCGNVDDFQN